MIIEPNQLYQPADIAKGLGWSEPTAWSAFPWARFGRKALLSGREILRHLRQRSLSDQGTIAHKSESSGHPDDRGGHQPPARKLHELRRIPRTNGVGRAA